MPDKRSDDLFADRTYIFQASFENGKNIQIWAHPDFRSLQLAEIYANRLTGPLGRLPESMRQGLSHVVMHRGNETAFAESQANFFVVYSDNMDFRISNNDLEETVFHESVHASLDSTYLQNPGWLAAQAADDAFITRYAADNSFQEDFAESALFAYTMMQHPGRLPAFIENWVRDNIPNRFEFFKTVFASDITTVVEPPTDFGDAPDSYGTTLDSDGARHVAIGPALGQRRDAELDAVGPLDATGDDNNGDDGDDEDGVMFGAIGVNASMAAVNVDVDLGDAPEAFANVWIDFNRNGIFGDAGEHVLQSRSVSGGVQTINYDLPSGLTVGEHYARVRVSTVANLGPTGAAPDGEVEDYVVQIADPPVVESVVVNGGDPGRSTVRQVQITFDRIVDLDFENGDVFEFINQTTGQTVLDLPIVDNSTGKTIVDVTFQPGPSVNPGGGLLDGDYRLNINSGLVSWISLNLDGSGDGQAGGNYVFGTGAADAFYRNYGDFDNNGSITLSDFAMFRSAFGGSGDPITLDPFDADSDGMVGLADFAQFRQNFGRASDVPA